MPPVTSVPPKLRPYVSHGLDLEWSDGSPQATGDCPWCYKEGKFSVSCDDGLWRCWVCGVGGSKGGGNVTTFLRLLHERAVAGTKDADLEDLARDRNLLDWTTLREWGVAMSPLTREWLVPGYNSERALVQLYRYATPRGGKKPILLATPEVHHGLFGANGLYNPSGADVYVTEGPWDAMALWEVLHRAKRDAGSVADAGKPGGEGGRLTLTGAKSASLLAGASVLGVPGANVFQPGWLPLFSGKRVNLLFDNDHPRAIPGREGEEGKTVDGAGLAGMRRAAEALGRVGAAEQPPEVRYLDWGEDGKGYDPELPSGYDLRDALDSPTAGERVGRLGLLFPKLSPIPETWVGGRTAKARASGGTDSDPIPCGSYRELQTAWRKSMEWIDGLDISLSVMLAVVVSTDGAGDPLWVKVVGPPSCGKTVLCEAVSVARRYVFPKDTMTSLMSGFQSDREGSENFSLAGMLDHKTLVIKDADTILQAPNLAQILSQFRALYDRSLRTQYGNRMSKDWERLSVTVIMCGTESLRRLDSSELGERLLDCVAVDELDAELEDLISLRRVHQTVRDVRVDVRDGGGEIDPPERTHAKRLTGGYVEHLRVNSRELFSSLEDPDEATSLRLVRLGTFVAFMRSRPSKSQDEAAQREMAFRLVGQFTRLALCLAVVLNRREVDGADGEVMRRVRKVALDTARGKSLEIAGELYAAGREGLETANVAVRIAHDEDKTGRLLKHMRAIKAIEKFTADPIPGLKVRGRPRWRLTSRLVSLYEEIV